MKTTTVAVSEELVELFRGTRLEAHPLDQQVTIALAIHLYLEERISIGKAAELAGIPRIEFELLVISMGLPAVRYGEADYEQDQRGWASFGPPDIPQ